MSCINDLPIDMRQKLADDVSDRSSDLVSVAHHYKLCPHCCLHMALVGTITCIAHNFNWDLTDDETRGNIADMFAIAMESATVSMTHEEPRH